MKIKILTAICIFLIFPSCIQNKRHDIPHQIQYDSHTDTSYLRSPVYKYNRIDSINNKPITFYLNHPEMDSIIRDIYYGKVLPENKQVDYIKHISLKSSPVLMPIYIQISNYLYSTTIHKLDITRDENEKNRMHRIQDKLRVDSIDNKPISYYLNNPNLDSLVRNYYNGELLPSDDEKTFRLLDLLILKNPDLYPFYFHCLTQICEDSDGALSEIMGPYCIQMIHNYPKGAFSYFGSDSLNLDRYASFIGYELYFVEFGTSDLKTNYKDFKIYLNNTLDLQDQLTKSTYDRFFNKIDDIMRYMDK